MNLRIPTWTFSLLVALGAVGCTSNVGSLKVTIVRCEEDEPLIGLAASVQLRVDGPDGLVGPVKFPVGAGEGTLPEIPTGPGHVLTVDGLGPEGNAVSRGRTGPLTIVEGENAITLFMGRLERFSCTPHSQSGGPEGGLIKPRAFHSATAVRGDKLLLLGGVADARWRPGAGQTPAALAQAELLDTTSLRFAKIDCGAGAVARCPREGRVGHTATQLSSGNVLLSGGITGGPGSAAIPEVEVFDASTLGFFAGAPLSQARARHAAVRSGDAVALVGGATDGESLVTGAVEFYRSGELDVQPQLETARRDFAMVRLSDGTLFVSGGFDGQGNPLASTELLKPNGARWLPGPTLAAARGFHTATRLPDGDVLIIGGLSSGGQATAVIERYDAGANVLREVDSLDLGRWAHSATRLTDGRVLVVGGYTLGVAGSPTRTVESIKVVSKTVLNVNTIGPLREERAGHSATLLPSGWLLVAGGVTIACDAQTPPQCQEQPSGKAEVFVY